MQMGGAMEAPPTPLGRNCFNFFLGASMAENHCKLQVIKGPSKANTLQQAVLVSVGSALTLHHAEHSQEGQQLGRNGRLVAVKRKDRRPETQH